MAEIVDYSTSAGSNNSASPNGYPENMAPSGLNNSNRETCARLKRHWKDTDGSVTTGGSSTAYTVTLNKGTTTLADIGPFTVELHTATGSGPTIAVNGGTAKNAAWADGTNLTTNDIAANTRVTFLYDADKDKFVVMSLATKPVLLSQTNTFTADQTITSTDAGQVGPTLKFYHNSASPAASDGVGYVTFNGKDGAGNETTYAKVFGEIVDTTDTSEDGRLAVQTVIAGSLASRAYIGAGIYTPNATGGDPGADKINAAGYQINGTAFGFPSVALYQNQQTSNTAGPNLTTGSWQTYPLTTEVYDADGIGSLSSNQITLGAGTYEVYASASIEGVTGPAASTWRARLYNATDTSVIVQGPNTGALGVAVSGNVHVFGYFTLAGSKAIELQVYMASNDAGAITAMNTGDVEVYASVHVKKIA